MNKKTTLNLGGFLLFPLRSCLSFPDKRDFVSLHILWVVFLIYGSQFIYAGLNKP